MPAKNPESVRRLPTLVCGRSDRLKEADQHQARAALHLRRAADLLSSSTPEPLRYDKFYNEAISLLAEARLEIMFAQCDHNKQFDGFINHIMRGEEPAKK